MQVLFTDFGNSEIVQRSDLVKCVVLPEIPALALAVECSNPDKVSVCNYNYIFTHDNYNYYSVLR